MMVRQIILLTGLLVYVLAGFANAKPLQTLSSGTVIDCWSGIARLVYLPVASSSGELTANGSPLVRTSGHRDGDQCILIGTSLTETVIIPNTGVVEAPSSCTLGLYTGGTFIYKGGKWKGVAGTCFQAAAGATAFKDLTDVPNTYVGQATKMPRVNTGETGLEYRTPVQILSDIGAASQANLDAHAGNTSNPHAVTKAQVGLSNVVNTLQLIAADIGVTIQARDADLDAIAALSPTNDDILQRKAGAWTNRTISQFKTDIGLASGISAVKTAQTITANSDQINVASGDARITEIVVQGDTQAYTLDSPPISLAGITSGHIAIIRGGADDAPVHLTLDGETYTLNCDDINTDFCSAVVVYYDGTVWRVLASSMALPGTNKNQFCLEMLGDDACIQSNGANSEISFLCSAGHCTIKVGGITIVSDGTIPGFLDLPGQTAGCTPGTDCKSGCSIIRIGDDGGTDKCTKIYAHTNGELWGVWDTNCDAACPANGDGQKILWGTVSTTDLGTDSVGSAAIAANAVGNSEMGDDAIGDAEAAWTESCELIITSAVDASEDEFCQKPYARTVTKVWAECYGTCSTPVIKICNGEDLGDNTCASNITDAGGLTATTAGASDNTLTNTSLAPDGSVSVLVTSGSADKIRVVVEYTR